MNTFKKLILSLIIALIPLLCLAFDFKEGGLCFNINDDGKSVTMTYENLILFALDAPSPTEKGYIGNVVIPDKVTHEGKKYKVTAIGDETFMCNSDLESVIIPKSVKTIGKGAFSHCYRLKEVILPPGLDEVNDYMFAESGLQSITIPDKIKSIGNYAFNNCPLKSITIPNSVITIGNSAFSACRWMENVTLGNSVKTIGEAAFSICTSLKSIDLPPSLVEIGPAAFYECDIRSLTIPASVRVINPGAFKSCHHLNSIRVEQGNKMYNSRDNCNAIIETESNILVVGCNCTTIPSAITKIGNEAFYGCEGLVNVEIPSSVTVIGDQAYFYCKSIKELTIPNSVKIINNRAFCGCDSLETVVISNSVEYIGEAAFLHDDHIKTLVIGSGVTAIDEWAFKGLDALTTITCEILEPGNVIMGKDVFDEIDKSACTLYVPRGTVDLYRATPQWNEFKNIVEK